MPIEEKRRHPRVKTENLVSYVCIDDGGNKIEMGKGKIKDVSLGGILIETYKSIETQDILLKIIGIDDKIMNIKGKVAYCGVGDFGTFRTGIKFLEAKEDIKLFVTNLIKIYSKQKTQ